MSIVSEGSVDVKNIIVDNARGERIHRLIFDRQVTLFLVGKAACPSIGPLSASIFVFDPDHIGIGTRIGVERIRSEIIGIVIRVAHFRVPQRFGCLIEGAKISMNPRMTLPIGPSNMKSRSHGLYPASISRLYPSAMLATNK